MIDPNGIRFDPDKHEYSVYSQTAKLWTGVPSVTTILKDMGFVDASFFTDYARERGTLVHRIIHWYCEGTLDECTIDDVLLPYFNAWLAFETDTGFISTETERPLASDLWRFAGTPDHIGMLNGRESVIDAKTGAIYPHVGLQLAAYEVLAGRPLRRFGLQLKEDGRYSLKEFKDRQDAQIFKAALACWHWQRNMGRA